MCLFDQAIHESFLMFIRNTKSLLSVHLGQQEYNRTHSTDHTICFTSNPANLIDSRCLHLLHPPLGEQSWICSWGQDLSPQRHCRTKVTNRRFEPREKMNTSGSTYFEGIHPYGEHLRWATRAPRRTASSTSSPTTISKPERWVAPPAGLPPWRASDPTAMTRSKTTFILGQVMWRTWTIPSLHLPWSRLVQSRASRRAPPATRATSATASGCA